MDSLVATDRMSDAAAAMVVKDGFSSSSFSLASTTTTSSFIALQRRIEFHPARKQYNGYTSNRDFAIETLNPDSEKKPSRLEDTTASAVAPRDVVTKRGVAAMDLLESEISTFDITFQRIGAGLRNIGNTCFLNSVLQCLTYTAPLAAYLQSGKHKSSCRIAGFCALCAFQKHVSRALQSTGMSFVPDLVSNMRCVSRTLKVSKQEDAHEYMVNLLESMHKCCLPSGVHSESPAAYERSLVHKIFGGHLRSRVECQQCSYCSDKLDPFLDLSLEINRAEALPTALRNFTAAELLDGGEKHYQCQRCKQKVRAKKRLTVHKPPYVLSIHLKRFSALDPGRKIEKKVSYERSLDMRPFVSNPNECDLKYSLYGVLVHYGRSTHYGHYVCFVRTSSGMWYSLDDEKVHHVGEKTVLNQNAYMLFYVRDRKHVAPRKPLDDVKKENKATVSGNIPNMAAKQMPNGVSIVNKKALLEIGMPKEALRKNKSVKQNNEPLKEECSTIKADIVLASSSKELLLRDPGVAESLNTSVLCITANGSLSTTPKDTTASGAVGNNATAEVLSSSNDEQNMATGKLPSAETSEKTVFASGSNTSDATISTTSVGNDSKVDSALLLTNLCCPKNQEGGIPADGTSDQVGHKVNLVDQELSRLETALPMSIECQLQSAPHRSPQKSMKKKLLKHPIHKLHRGTNFFKTVLQHGIKKKNRKRKHRNSDTLKLLKQQLEINESPSEVEPSTSQNSAPPFGSENSQTKSATPHSKQVSAVVDAQDVVEELSQRNSQNGTVLATSEQLQSSSVSTLAENDRSDAAPNGVATISTQDLRKEAASWWNDSKPSRNQKSKHGEIAKSIGYIGDEWDEEYDQGKRKKLRLSKVEFGGPNLFQQAALEKSKQRKEQKVDGKWMRKEKRRH
ncbi:Ubiquitin carboxyl-terminal hydrolase 23 [Linum perenne]